MDVSGWLGAGIAVIDHQIAHICPQPDLRYRPLGANQAAKQLLSMKNPAANLFDIPPPGKSCQDINDTQGFLKMEKYV